MPAVGASGVHEATGVGPLTIVEPGQVVVVKLLPEVGPEGEHDATAVPVALLSEQAVAVQALPLVAAASVHEATGTLVVVIAAGHVVVV